MKPFHPTLACAAALATAPAVAATTPIVPTGEVELSVEDLVTPMLTRTFDLTAPGAGSHPLTTFDGTSASVSYDLIADDRSVSLDLLALLAAGETPGTATADAVFTFVTTVETWFEFAVNPAAGAYRPPASFSASFAGSTASFAIDASPEAEVTGTLADGPFLATGFLPSGTHVFSLSAFETTSRRSAVAGGAEVSLSLTATSIPLPTASLLGLTTLAAASASRTMRRPQP